MKTVSICGTTIEIDEERTAGALKQRMRGAPQVENYAYWKDCPCAECINARMTSRRFMPPDLRDLLVSVGLDPWDPWPHLFVEQKYHHKQNMQRNFRCWYFYGRLLGEKLSGRQEFGPGNWVEVGLAVNTVHRSKHWRENTDPDDPNRIYIVTSILHPWIHDQICTIRHDYVLSQCSECSSRWRETGYLKHKSRIPDIFGLRELTVTLRSRKVRVYVEFCAGCGKFEHQIVPNRPRFRSRNTLYRDEMRVQRALRAKRKLTS